MSSSTNKEEVVGSISKELEEKESDATEEKIASKSDLQQQQDQRMVTLISRDDQVYQLPMRAAILSILVKDALSQDDDDVEDDTDPSTTNDESSYKVDVLRVNGKTLEKVVDFMKHHQMCEAMEEIPMPLAGGCVFDEIVKQEWYKQFASDENIDTQESLFEMLAAAKYMNIKPLLDLACLKLTFQLTEKTTDEIRSILNLSELTGEEEERAREEHPWVFED